MKVIVETNNGKNTCYIPYDTLAAYCSKEIDTYRKMAAESETEEEKTYYEGLMLNMSHCLTKFTDDLKKTLSVTIERSGS